MKKRIITIALLAVSATVLFGSQRKVSGQDVTRHYLILAKAQGAGSTNFRDKIAAANGTVTNVIESIGVVMAVSNNPNFVAAVKAAPNVQAVSEDVQVQWLPLNEKAAEATNITPGRAGVNSEPFNGFQWNLRQIHADQTAANGDRGKGVVRARVAVLDQGIVTNHEDIAPNLNLALSKSFVPNEDLNPPTPGFNHGTHVAGIIAAPINGKGIQGVAPEAEIVAVKVLSATTGSGSFGSLISGIEYASGSSVDADVINMSLGATFDRINAGGDGTGPLLAALNRAINHATAQGTLVVSSAGNEAVNLNGRIWTIPAQSGNGMAISATGPIALDNFDQLASYSNYGQSVINVAAPGGDFRRYPSLTPTPWYLDMVLGPAGKPTKTSPGGSYSFSAGTSMAAPHVSGVAALIVGKYGHMPPAQLRALIEKSADDILKSGTDAESGNGRINALKALQ